MVRIIFQVSVRYNNRSVYVAQPPQIDESTLLAMQQHMAQQAAFAQIPDVVKRVSNVASTLNLLAHMLCSLLYTFTKQYWITILQRSQLRMRVDGIVLQRNIMQRRNGPRRRLSLPW